MSDAYPRRLFQIVIYIVGDTFAAISGNCCRQK